MITLQYQQHVSHYNINNEYLITSGCLVSHILRVTFTGCEITLHSASDPRMHSSLIERITLTREALKCYSLCVRRRNQTTYQTRMYKRYNLHLYTNTETVIHYKRKTSKCFYSNFITKLGYIHFSLVLKFLFAMYIVCIMFIFYVTVYLNIHICVCVCMFSMYA